ncbi:hypothetical protein CICLE_v10006546mg, partial [Citrus x clementina]
MAPKSFEKLKVEIKKIENEDDRMITFSERRSGIYKKAPRFAIMVVSPSGEPYSFGHPSIEAVANRFLGLNQPPIDNNHPLAEARRQLPSFQYNKK